MIPGFRDGRRYIMVPFKIASAVINAMFTRLNTLAYAIGEKRKQEKIQAAKNWELRLYCRKGIACINPGDFFLLLLVSVTVRPPPHLPIPLSMCFKSNSFNMRSNMVFKNEQIVPASICGEILSNVISMDNVSPFSSKHSDFCITWRVFSVIFPTPYPVVNVPCHFLLSALYWMYRLLAQSITFKKEGHTWTNML